VLRSATSSRAPGAGVFGSGGGASGGDTSRGRWGARRFSFLSLEWAIVADIDLESERLRCLGDARFDVYGALRGLCLRRYRGRFSYLPADRRLCAGRASWWGKDGHVPGDLAEEAGAGAGGGEGGGAEAGAAAAAAGAEAGAAADAPPTLRHLAPFDVPTPLSWRTVEGVFTLLWVTNSTHQSVGVAVSPAAHHSDGVMSVCLVRDSNPLAMLRVLLALDEAGSVERAPGVTTFTCSAWRLEPAPPPPGHAAGAGGYHLALDGEALPYGPVQAELHPGLLRVFG